MFNECPSSLRMLYISNTFSEICVFGCHFWIFLGPNTASHTNPNVLKRPETTQGSPRCPQDHPCPPKIAQRPPRTPPKVPPRWPQESIEDLRDTFPTSLSSLLSFLLSSSLLIYFIVSSISSNPHLPSWILSYTVSSMIMSYLLFSSRPSSSLALSCLILPSPCMSLFLLKSSRPFVPCRSSFVSLVAIPCILSYPSVLESYNYAMCYVSHLPSSLFIWRFALLFLFSPPLLSSLICSALLCPALLYSALLCSPLFSNLISALLFVQHSAFLLPSLLYFSLMLCSSPLMSGLLYSALRAALCSLPSTPYSPLRNANEV